MTELHHIPAALILPLLLAVSCTKHSPEQDRSAIAFAPAPHTKSIVKAPAEMQPFAVWGYFTPKGNTASEEIFSRTKVYRPDDGFGDWTYDSPRYWTEGSYRFYAVHPFPDATAVKAACTDGTGLTVDFSSPAADIDLMTAAATPTYSAAYPASADAVPLDFGHLLARVSVVAETGAEDAVVNSLTLSGIVLDGSYDAGNADAPWTLGTALAMIDADISDEGLLLSTKEANSLLPNLLLIPQTPGSVEVTYTIGDAEPETKTLSLPSDPVWQSGRHYCYTLTIGSADVLLSVEMVQWTERDYTVTF